MEASAAPGRKVKMTDGERVIFTEEGYPSQYLKLIASCEVDDVSLESLEDFVKRRRKRLGISSNSTRCDGRGNGLGSAQLFQLVQQPVHFLEQLLFGVDAAPKDDARPRRVQTLTFETAHTMG